MEVNADKYKYTDIGYFPNDWDVQCLKNLTIKVGSGITPTGGQKLYKNEGRPFIRSQNVGWGELLLFNVAYIDDETHFRFKSTEIQENDILLNITGASIGRSAIANKKILGGNVNQHVCILRVNNNLVIPKFLNALILSELVQSQINSFQAGGNRQGLNFGQIKSIAVPLPNLSEQKAIDQVLSDINNLIRSLEKQIAKKRLIKQGVLQRLLTGKIRLKLFDRNWHEVELQRIVSQFIVPMRDKPKLFSGNIPWCRIEDFEGKYLFDSKTNQYVDYITIGKMNLKVYPKETLLVSCSADLGKCAIVKQPLVSNQTFIGLVINNDCASNEFLFYYMSFNSKRLNNLSSGTTISYMSREQFEKFRVFIPESKEEQSQIAKNLSDIDIEIEKIEIKLLKYKSLKQGLMQNLLTGKIRLLKS